MCSIFNLIFADSCITVGGASPNLPCVFPFKFNNVVYNNCTLMYAHHTNNKTWCSTKVDANGVHMSNSGNWGNCGPDCEAETEMTFSNSIVKCLE